MRQAINNLQATHSGAGFVGEEDVFRICDLPPPTHITKIVGCCQSGDLKNALDGLHKLVESGHAISDISSSFFRIVKNASTTNKSLSINNTNNNNNKNSFELSEAVQLDYLKQVGLAQCRIAEGCDNVLQLDAMIAAMCRPSIPDAKFQIKLYN